MRAFDFWFSFKFFNRQEDSHLMVTVFADIFISGHLDLLIVRQFTVIISTIISDFDGAVDRKDKILQSPHIIEHVPKFLRTLLPIVKYPDQFSAYSQYRVR
jgi:hypothetical protein